MLRQRTEEEYEASSGGGERYLFALGQYEFRDTIGDEDGLHHFIREAPGDGADPRHYEVDRDTMYEFMARYLAGAYELEEYDLEQSPSHMSLLDVLEIATARARAGESEFSWEAFDQVETEVLGDEADDEDEGGAEDHPEGHAR